MSCKVAHIYSVTDSVEGFYRDDMEHHVSLYHVSRMLLCIFLAVSCLSTKLVTQSSVILPSTATCCKAENPFGRRHGLHFSIWRHLVCITTGVYTRQNLMNDVDVDYTVDGVLIVLFGVSSIRKASYFMSLISEDRPHIQFVSFQTGNDSSSNPDTNDIVDMLIEYNNKSHSVIFFSDDVGTVVQLLEAVSLSEQLRYTELLHTTEWLIVLTSLLGNIPSDLLESSRTVDFITLVHMTFINTTLISQKSRVQNLTVTAKVIDYNIHPGQPICEVNNWPGTSCGPLRSLKEILRKSARVFLKSQKSVLEGMRLPVAVTDSIVRGNLNGLDRHGMGLLHLLATSLGFTPELVSSSDRGNYGLVTDEDNGTGISGLLARREAAMSTMGLSLTDNRLKAVNYIPVLTFEEPYFIVYRWPHRKDKIDLIYIYIVKWEFIYVLMGTILSLGFIGAIVHMATRSCSTQVIERPTVFDIRSPGRYVAHSGRILLACWAVFLVVLGSAYSGFLVTDFVTAEAPPVKSLEQLNSNKDFSVGIHGPSDYTMFLLNTSMDEVLKTFLARLRQFSIKDPEILSGNLQVQMDKILAGGYAYVGSACFPLGMCEKYLPENFQDLVFFPVEDKKLHGDCYVSVGKGVFFQRDLYQLLLHLDQMGILDFLRRKFLTSRLVNHAISSQKSTIYQNHSESTRVGFVRILFVVYLAVAGIGVGVVCLFVELLVYRLRVKSNLCT